MFASNYQLWTRGRDGQIGSDRHAFQWAPTLTVHDPNPPITLEDAPVVPPATGAPQLALLGVGL